MSSRLNNLAVADPAALEPQPLGPSRWDWSTVNRILVVRLRSIGDTVLATPALRALRRFLPESRIDLLLEDWVAPLMDGFSAIDEVITVPRHGTGARARLAARLRARHYDVAYNLHGGTTAGFLIRASGATHRVGFAEYRYSALYNHLAPATTELWREEGLHSADQQLAIFGWTGVPVTDRPMTELGRSAVAEAAIAARLKSAGLEPGKKFALIHPAAAFDTKRWAAEKFAAISDQLNVRGIAPILVASAPEKDRLEQVSAKCNQIPIGWYDLSLPEITALARRARIFVGNDSGIAHIAAAVKLPTVVIFGSSNIAHWRPWTSVPSAVVEVGMPCAPCPGYTCGEFATPQCIERITVAQVTSAIDSVLASSS